MADQPEPAHKCTRLPFWWSQSHAVLQQPEQPAESAAAVQQTPQSSPTLVPAIEPTPGLPSWWVLESHVLVHATAPLPSPEEEMATMKQSSSEPMKQSSVEPVTQGSVEQVVSPSLTKGPMEKGPMLWVARTTSSLRDAFAGFGLCGVGPRNPNKDEPGLKVVRSGEGAADALNVSKVKSTGAYLHVRPHC